MNNVDNFFYSFFLVCAIVFGLAGFAFPVAWALAGFCIFSLLIMNNATKMKSEMEAAKGDELNVVERSAGCGVSFLLLAMGAIALFVIILSMGGKI